MKLTYCIDPASIESWLSLVPTQQLIETTIAEKPLDFEVVPMTRSLGNVAADSERPNDPLAEYKARRAAARKQFADAELRRNCESLGLSLEAGARKVDGTPGALCLLSQAADRDSGDVMAPFLIAARWYELVFREGQTPEMAAAELMNPTATLSDLTAAMDNLLEQGLFSAPAYILHLDDEEPERFHGRQHLPLLRWLIDGRHGNPPV